MTDKIRGPIFTPFKFVLYLASLLYRLGLFSRRLFYKVGIFKSHRVPMRILSVGNLTLGGTGKTPFVICLARILKEELKKDPCVLIRGYGWDEQTMLKQRLPDIPILVGENRVKRATRAIKLYGCDIAILDDGFQYWELKRELNIVLIDSRNPFGNGRLFPRGTLREPVHSVTRADMVVFTKVNKRLIDINELKGDLTKMKSEIVFLEALHKPRYIYDTKSKKVFELAHIRDKRVILLSSIGDPNYFEETVKDLKAQVLEHIVFVDHHNYRERDIERIIKRCEMRQFEFLLTTEKDAVKLERMRLSMGRYALMALAVEMELTTGREILIDRLRSLYIS